MARTMVDDYAERLKTAMGGDTPDRITKLAKALDLTYNAVKKVVTGDTRYFIVPNHYRAARLLGVRPEWLGLGEGPMREEATTAEDDARVDWRTLAMSIAAAHPHSDVREQLLDFCDRVDAQAAELKKLTDRRVKAHTP